MQRHLIPELFAAEADVVEACGEDPSVVCETVYDWTSNRAVSLAAEWLVGKPIKIVLILVLAWLVRRLVIRAIDRAVEKVLQRQDDAVEVEEEDDRALPRHFLARRLTELNERAERAHQRTRTLAVVAKSATTVTVVVVATMMILGELQINLGPLVAGAGIVGVAIGFGAQSLVRDLISGIFMLIEDQYGVGDVVDVGEAVGTVEEVGLRTTRLRAVDGTLWYVPNGEIRRVGNMSQLWAKAILDVEVAYGTDLSLASDTIKQVADEFWREELEDATILEEPAVLGVQSLGANAVAIRLSVKTDPSEQWAVARELRRRLKDEFDRRGIEIPFPQRTVWVRNESGSEELG